MEFDWREAKRRYEAGETWRQLGVAYGVDESVVRRKVSPLIEKRRPRGGRCVAPLDRVAELHASGLGLKAIADELGLSQTAIKTAFDQIGIARTSALPRNKRELTDSEKAHLKQLWERVPGRHRGIDWTSKEFTAFFDAADAITRSGEVPDWAIAEVAGVSSIRHWRRRLGRPRNSRPALPTQKRSAGRS